MLMFSYCLILNSLLSVDAAERQSPLRFILISAAVSGVAIILLPIVNYLGMSLLDDMEQLPAQVETFRIEQSECFCCSNNHKHPQTGKTIMCDRELVYHSLAIMYSYLDQAGELEKFNRLVRETFAPKVFWRFGLLGTHLPLRYVARIVMASNLPFLSDLFWRISQGPETQIRDIEYVVWCTRLILHWLQPLLAMFFSVELSARMWKMTKNLKLRRIFLSILLSPIQGLGAGCIFASMELAVRWSADTSWAPLVPFLLGLLLNFLLHLF